MDTVRSAPGESRPPRRPRRGFTIVEVMVAAAVMVFGITSSILVIQHGYRALDTARNTNLAAQIIQSEMERIRLLSWGGPNGVSSLPASSDVAIRDILPDDLSSISELENRFTIRRSATDVADKPGEMKQITVTVTWRGIDGQDHRRSSTTHYCKDGLYAYYYTKAGS